MRLLLASHSASINARSAVFEKNRLIRQARAVDARIAILAGMGRPMVFAAEKVMLPALLSIERFAESDF